MLQTRMQHKAVGKDNIYCPLRKSLLPIKSEMQSSLTFENNTVKLLCCQLHCGFISQCGKIYNFLCFSSLALKSHCALLRTLKDCASSCAHSLCFSSSALEESSLCNAIQLGSWVSWRTSRPYTAALLSGRGHSFALFFFFSAAQHAWHKLNFQQQQQWTGKLPVWPLLWCRTPDLTLWVSIRYT